MEKANKQHKGVFVLNIIFDIFEIILFLGLLVVELSGRLEHNPLVWIIIVGLFPGIYFFLTFAFGKKHNKYIQVMIVKVILVVVMLLFSNSIDRYFVFDQYSAEQYAYSIFSEHHSNERMTQFIDGNLEYERYNADDRYIKCKSTITAEFENNKTKEKETYTEVIEIKFDRKTGKFC